MNREKLNPFGMLMPGRSYSAGDGYRYGFNGKEQDNEVSGQGNEYDYGFRIYNPRVGRFLSVDPLFRSYPWYTPYQFAGNKPVICIDLDGLEEVEVNGIKITLTAGYDSKLRQQAAGLAKTNPNQLAAMQQQAWNKLLVKIDAVVPNYFDYRHNLNGILWDPYQWDIENQILLSDEAAEFNSLYNYKDEGYQDIKPLFILAGNNLANDHYRASMCGEGFYSKFINEINEAKDPNTKAALIERRGKIAGENINAFRAALIEGAVTFLEMYGYGRMSTSPEAPESPSSLPSSRYFNFSSSVRSGSLRFVKNESGELEDLQPTLNRIRAGGKFPHRNDGKEFMNREGFLPKQPAKYYTEYVHPTKGINHAGRQRIIMGKGGEIWYTPDHYEKTFIRIK